MINGHLIGIQKTMLFAPKTSLEGPDIAKNKAILDMKENWANGLSDGLAIA